MGSNGIGYQVGNLQSDDVVHLILKNELANSCSQSLRVDPFRSTVSQTILTHRHIPEGDEYCLSRQIETYFWRPQEITSFAQGIFIPFRDVFERESVIPTNEFVGLWKSSPPGMCRRVVGTRFFASAQVARRRDMENWSLWVWADAPFNK